VAVGPSVRWPERGPSILNIKRLCYNHPAATETAARTAYLDNHIDERGSGWQPFGADLGSFQLGRLLRAPRALRMRYAPAAPLRRPGCEQSGDSGEVLHKGIVYTSNRRSLCSVP
jgi:hypothetical protein